MSIPATSSLVDHAVEAQIHYIAAGRAKVDAIKRLDDVESKEFVVRIKALREAGADV